VPLQVLTVTHLRSLKSYANELFIYIGICISILDIQMHMCLFVRLFGFLSFAVVCVVVTFVWDGETAQAGEVYRLVEWGSQPHTLLGF
jgi:hypothetical protein